MESGTTAEKRLAAILTLPLRSEPETEQERAILEEADEEMLSGRPGHTTEEMLETIERMRHDQGG